MRGATLVLCTAAIVLVGSIPNTSRSQSTPTAAPGVAAGEKIGNTIKSAISTALPGLTSLVDLIFSHTSKPDAPSATKTDLQTAAATASAKKEYQKQFEASVQQKLQPVGRVAKEIEVLNRFLGPSVNATIYLVEVRTLVPKGQQNRRGRKLKTLGSLQINN